MPNIKPAVEKNLEELNKKIEAACLRSGRSTDDVTLIAVTKTVGVSDIMKAVDCGVEVLGENRVQELCEKYPQIENAVWHLIGHLQTNKVKNVVGKAEIIHSVDSLHLAEAINNEAKKKGIVQKILLEVNISGEESKYGLTTEQIPTIINNIEKLSSIRFCGFMTMAPLGASEKTLREVFSSARTLFEEYKSRGAEVLSMGMSGDFETAIEEGATHIRVGSFIFKR